MDIGNTHIDGSILLALALAVGAGLAIYLLLNRPQPPIEHPSTRAIRLVKEMWRVIPEGPVYFVPDEADRVTRVSSMTARDRTYHSSGRLVRRRDGRFEVALVAKDQNPESVQDARLWKKM